MSTAYDNFEMTEADRKELETQKLLFDRIFLDVYNTPAGKKLFETLKERFMDRKMAHLGDSPEQIFHRQGQYDLVDMMFKCVEDATT